MKVLFCNIGWMEKYEGLANRDRISGGGSYVDKKHWGEEICNFSRHDDFFMALCSARRTP